MKKENKYGLSLINLKNKEYQHHFLVDKAFFAQIEDQEATIEEANIDVNISMLKSETMIQLFFHCAGAVQLICDRSLDTFEYPIDFKEKMIFKFGEEDKVISDELEVINRTRTFLDLSQYLYEIIHLAIPMKKLHPRFEEEDEDEEESELMMIYQSDATEKKASEKQENEDPRWAALKKLKDSHK